MYKWFGCLMLSCLFFLSGCMSSTAYKDKDVAAVVRGEKITVGYLRFLYPDDALTDMVEGAVKAKLAEQEVKKMNIDISKQVIDIKESHGTYPPDELKSAEAQSIRTFADPQAAKLGIEPQEYYKKYTETSAKMVAYINTYTSEILGELKDDEFGIEEYDHHANELLDDLVEQNKEAIEIRIK
ncbi:hypothetical protein QR721_06550 [Aciduricibacillus chroicocephali]|uniref:Lipoprotein n=1 Tax=Aciduricibacillus chroicocephali TaxID=3054939 RepID=A0ABY9KYP9_9BACI|nr:hypothetical protein QR721_06550 [Bacillaceae bacterium 44XB]